jgi:transposase
LARRCSRSAASTERSSWSSSAIRRYSTRPGAWTRYTWAATPAEVRVTRNPGPIVAASILCAWPHPGRCPTDAAFAMLAGAAPIPASSGQRVRVRLNRSGDRHLNQALHLVVLTRLRYDPATRAYAQRRRAEGKTNREIRRCLVRYVARQLYRLLEAQPAL